MNLNKSLADELNQPTSFLTACSNKKSEKPNKTQNPVGWAFLKKPGFFLTLACYQIKSVKAPKDDFI